MLLSLYIVESDDKSVDEIDINFIKKRYKIPSKIIQFFLKSESLFEQRNGHFFSKYYEPLIGKIDGLSEKMRKNVESRYAKASTIVATKVATEVRTEIRNKNKEERSKSNILVVQQSNDTLTILENPQDTKPPSKKISKSKSEPGFWIEGEKFESFQDEKLQQWLQPRINKFVLMQSWLTPEIVEDCFQKFFIKDEFYHNTWKGLYTHFSNYCQQRKKSEYINFKTPEKSKQWHAANSLIQELRKNPTSNDEFPFG